MQAVARRTATTNFMGLLQAVVARSMQESARASDATKLVGLPLKGIPPVGSQPMWPVAVVVGLSPSGIVPDIRGRSPQ